MAPKRDKRQKACQEDSTVCATSNRKQLTALIVAGTKLRAASSLAKDALSDIASSGLLPVEVHKDLWKIAKALDEYIKQQITSTIEHIP